MRHVRHGVDETLPPPVAAPMTRVDLWEAVESITRVQGELVRRGVAEDVFETIDAARGVMLALYATADESGHSVHVA